MHVHIGDGRFDRGHVAIDTLAARRAGTMMGVLLERGGAWSVGHSGAVARKADLVSRCTQLSVV